MHTKGYRERSQAQATAVDEELMGPLGFSVDSLMELAGLSVACALAAEYPAATFPRVLVLAGPGNNGGDGLVAARHLAHFGYTVSVVYPKPTDKPLYNGLTTQLRSLGVPFLDWGTACGGGGGGCSAGNATSSPFDDILKALQPSSRPPPIVSIDIPSGWDVEGGPLPAGAMQPQMLVSLTAPKKAAQHFKGPHHYLGGRFVPPAIREKYQLHLPSFPGTSMVVRLDDNAGSFEHPAQPWSPVQAHPRRRRPAAPPPPGAATPLTAAGAVADMRISYERGGLEEAHYRGRDPITVFDEWFKDAVEQKAAVEVNAICLSSADKEGRPSARIVLLKGYDARGFVFYSNFRSKKGQEMGNGHAAFVSFWEPLQRQVRVEGTVEKLPEAESTEYYHSRPRGSQIGAWVSQQSEVVEGREVLEARNAELQLLYADASVPVPKPAHWGGFLIRPTRIEFWQGRPSRLHDRISYRREGTDNDDWTMERLQP
ncbi:MAG: hypothetical protein WDW36_004500 [Sanguina aurantia]